MSSQSLRYSLRAGAKKKPKRKSPAKKRKSTSKKPKRKSPAKKRKSTKKPKRKSPAARKKSSSKSPSKKEVDAFYKELKCYGLHYGHTKKDAKKILMGMKKRKKRS